MYTYTHCSSAGVHVQSATSHTHQQSPSIPCTMSSGPGFLKTAHGREPSAREVNTSRGRSQTATPRRSCEPARKGEGPRLARSGFLGSKYSERSAGGKSGSVNGSQFCREREREREKLMVCLDHCWVRECVCTVRAK